MKVLITGADGMLGRDAADAFRCGCEVAAVSRNDLDITNNSHTETAVQSIKPDIVINCAAFTDVDACETETVRAFAVNAEGAANIASACAKTGAVLIHISTDYVFDGLKGSPYVEQDTPAPINIYGKSKLEGEEAVRSLCERHFIVRTQSLYGNTGKNFVRTMLRLAGAGTPLSVVNDQFSSPTYTRDLAEAIRTLAASDAYGTYHITNSGVCSWYEFASEIFMLSRIDANLSSCKAIDFPRPARRPPYSALENSKWKAVGNAPLREWRHALEEYITGAY